MAASDMPKKKKAKTSNLKWDVTKCKFYKDNYGYYMSWGLFLWINVGHIVAYVCIVGTHAPCFLITCYLIFEDEFAVFTETLHLTILLFLAMLATLTIRKRKLEVLIRNFDEGLHEYGNTIDQESAEEIDKIKINLFTRKRFRSRFMIFGIIMAALTIIVVRPVYDMATGKYSQPNFKNNINRYLPVLLWYPLDVSSWTCQIITFIMEYYLVIQTMLLTIASTITFITMSEELCLQLSILKITLKNIVPRAKHAGEGTVTKENLCDCLRRCVIHHCNIIDCFKLLQQFYFWLLWLIFTISTYMLCLGAFLLTMGNMQLSYLITSLFFFVFEIFHLLIYCWYGEEIQSLSADLFQELYHSDWIEHRVKIRKYMLIIQARTLHPLKLSCGGLMFANLNTFGNVCSSAYSYFNVLNASRGK